jgi:hypothetical protein
MIFLSALVSLWLLAGLMSFYVASTTPRDPRKPVVEQDAAFWVMLVWASIALIALGPIGLDTALEIRARRKKELA